MRILLPHPILEDTFVDNVRDSLLAMGHEVHALGDVRRERYWGLAQRLLRRSEEALLPQHPSALDRAVLRAAKSLRPDMVLSTTIALHPAVLEELRAVCPGRRVLWWGDPVANSPRWGILAPGWDAVFLKDPDAVTKLRMAGREAFLLHEAMNPRWHRAVAGRENERVAIVGSFYAFRQAIALRLNADGVALDLRGPPPPRWAHPTIRRLHSGSYVAREAKSAVFGRALACLNTFCLAEGNSLNCRAFEIAGAAGLQLIESRPIISECFEPGKEVLVFHSYETLLEHIARAKREPKSVDQIRQAGARRALAEHTYEQRLRVLLRTVG